MPFNKALWRSKYDALPAWPCPTCGIGGFRIQRDSFKKLETGPSIKSREHDDFDPEWIEERFACFLVCQNNTCGEVIVVAGRTHHVEILTEEFDRDWAEKLEPRFVNPAPPIFAIPKECPLSVSTQLVRAFGLFWSDKASCANCLRSAVEALLTERKIPKSTLNNRRKRVPLSLHSRLDRFKQMNQSAAEYLLAIKWLGNIGSHANEIFHIDDLLEGFEIFEHVTHEIYVQRGKHIAKVARAINARKGRPRRR